MYLFYDVEPYTMNDADKLVVAGLLLMIIPAVLILLTIV